MDIHFDLPKNRSNVIKVIGVGGGGSNAINHMFSQGIDGVDFVVCNTDAQALENSPVPIKVQLGLNLTEGLGAGANPEVGEQAALESFEDLKDLLDTNTKMVFITAGMGGGTGTGAAPIIAKQARDMDILTVGIVTIPFKFEGKVRNKQAQMGVEKLRRNVDSLVVIDNDKLREVYGNLGFKSGFSKADEVLSTAARGIAEVITNHYTQNIDLRDAKTVLSSSGTAIMGSAQASGENRAQDAIRKALDSPLLNDNKITGAKNVLLLIVSGSQEITLDEIGEINDHIQDEAGHNANIIMGVGEDENLGESIAVTIIATGFNPDQQDEIVNTDSKKIIHTLEEEQTSTHDLSPQSPVVKRTLQRPAQPRRTEDASARDTTHTNRVHHLEEDPADEEDSVQREDDYIPTTEFLKDVEVNYQEVIYDEEDFVFIDQSDQEEELFEMEQNTAESEEIEENEMLVFDLPLARSDQQQNVQQNKAEGNTDNSTKASSFEQIELFPNSGEQGETRYDLQDYIEKERELTEARPDHYGEPRLKQEESQRSPSQDARGIAGEPSSEVEEQSQKIDPLTSSISEGLAARASERRARLKKFNYKFRKNSNIEEIERQPAYKRAGIELDGARSDAEEEGWSRSSVQFDEDGQPRISKNNSYLHDNVD